MTPPFLVIFWLCCCMWRSFCLSAYSDQIRGVTKVYLRRKFNGECVSFWLQGCGLWFRLSLIQFLGYFTLGLLSCPSLYLSLSLNLNFTSHSFILSSSNIQSLFLKTMRISSAQAHCELQTVNWIKFNKQTQPFFLLHTKYFDRVVNLKAKQLCS